MKARQPGRAGMNPMQQELAVAVRPQQTIDPRRLTLEPVTSPTFGRGEKSRQLALRLVQDLQHAFEPTSYAIGARSFFLGVIPCTARFNSPRSLSSFSCSSAIPTSAFTFTL